MTTDKTYNGWTNYETWNVALWLGNNAGDYNYWQEATADAWEDSKTGKYYDWETREQYALRLLSERLKDEIETAAQDMLEQAQQQTSMFADLLSGAIAEVNWREIAEHWLDDFDKPAEAETAADLDA
jgi:hypothetical protein